MTNFPIRLILNNLRSAGNVGQILRTADAAKVELVYACGYTPYPRPPQDDPRPAHVASTVHHAIAKTALGAEASVPLLHIADVTTAIREAKNDGCKIIVIEQSEKALGLFDYQPPAAPLAIILGNEVEGVPAGLMASADTILELPMLGRKESLNVAAAAAIALYQLRFGA